MKKVFFMLMSLAMVFTVSAQDLKGKWNFDAAGAPDGYGQGTIEFKTVDKKSTAKIVIGYSSFEVPVQKKSASTYTCSLNVDGSDVFVTINNKNGKLSGTAEAEGMQMNVKFMAPALNGKWKFDAAEAPEGYGQGTIEFKTINQKNMARIVIGYNSYEVPLQKKSATTYGCHLNVEGSDVNVTISTKDGKLSGTAEAEGMQMNVKFIAQGN